MTVSKANQYAHRIFGNNICGRAISSIFIGVEYLNVHHAIKQKERVFTSVDTAEGIPESFYFYFYEEESAIIAFGEFPNEENIQVHKNFITQSNELNTLSREIQRKNALLNKTMNDLELSHKELERLSSFKSMLVASISHDMRNSLNAIMGITQLLSQSSLDDKQQKLINALQSSGNLFHELLEEVLDYSRLESGKLEYVAQPFDLHLLLEDLQSHFIVPQMNNDLTLEVHVNTDSPAYPVSDSYRLKQVLSNLISNAVKYTPKGIVRISAHIETISDDNSILILGVKDNGRGIPLDMQERIFEPYRQTHSDDERKQKGAGLGLTIVKKMVELLGGTIELESQFGEGTNFTVKVPITLSQVLDEEVSGKKVLKEEVLEEQKQSSASNEENIAPAEEVSLLKIRILIVDDEPVNRIVFEQMLGNLGLSTFVAQSGIEALEILENETIDLVFTDCTMDNMDGYTLADHIRQKHKPSPLIIAVSGSTHQDVISNDTKEALDGYLSKPLSINALKDVLNKYLNTNF
ncbi:MAG: response regulator [Planctomycetes bacterium]|nr:response regulator [Planctomycetota bacterium]